MASEPTGFGLSKSNQIYLGTVSLIYFGIFWAFKEKTPEEIGGLVGSVLVFAAFPGLLAWLAWRLAGRRESTGSLVFNLMLTLLILGQVGDFARKANQSRALGGLENDLTTLRENFANTDDPEAVNAAFEQYQDSFQRGLEELADASVGKEKEFFQIMSAFTQRTQSLADAWTASFDATQEPRILDFSLLAGDAEFQHQRTVLNQYIDKTKAYTTHHAGLMTDLERRLAPFGPEVKLAVGALTGARRTYERQKPVMAPLLQAHLAYGNGMLKILDLLDRNRGSWSYENDELVIGPDEIDAQFDSLWEDMGAQEEKINTLWEQLARLIAGQAR